MNHNEKAITAKDASKLGALEGIMYPRAKFSMRTYSDRVEVWCKRGKRVATRVHTRQFNAQSV